MATGDGIRRVRSALASRGTPLPDSGRIACPAHGGDGLNLSVTQGEAGAMVFCHSKGCTAASIAEAIGMQPGALFDDWQDGHDFAGKHSSPGRVTHYPYADEGGSLLFRVVRTDFDDGREKEIKQQPYSATKADFVWEKLAGVRRVLYRLGDVRAAIERGETVYLTEGEKAADALRERLGVCATTASGGAAKWLHAAAQPPYAESLRGARVVLLADADEPGEAHMLTAAESLLGVAASVKTVRFPNLPPKGDAVEWLGAGGTLDDLHALENATPPHTRAMLDAAATAERSAGATAAAAALAAEAGPPFAGERCGLMVTDASGKACTIIGYPLASPDAPFLVDEANIKRATERARLLDAAPDEYRGELNELLLRCADWKARQPEKKPSKAPEANAASSAAARVYPAIEPAGEPQDGLELFGDIYSTIRRYIWLKDDAAVFLSLWVLHTYALDVAEHTPYVHIFAPAKQCGKSTLLDVLAGLVAKGVRVSNLSTPFLFRVLDSDAPTLLIDEVSAWLNGPHTGELRGILNDGYHRNGRVGRVESSSKDGATEFRPTFFSVWGAKAFSGIGRELSDELLDRCVPVRLERVADNQRAHLVKLRGRDYGALAEVMRGRCARWIADALPNLQGARPELPDVLSGRQQDIWEPVLAIADAIDPSIGQRARAAAVALHDRPTMGIGEQLLADLRDIFAGIDGPARDFISTEELLQSLSSRDDRPWCEMPSTHRPLTGRGLSTLLKHFNIEHGRPNGKSARGYDRASFRDAWIKYCPENDAKKDHTALPLSGTSGTSGISEAHKPPEAPEVPEVPDNGSGKEEISAKTPAFGCSTCSRHFFNDSFGDPCTFCRKASAEANSQPTAPAPTIARAESGTGTDADKSPDPTPAGAWFFATYGEGDATDEAA